MNGWQIIALVALVLAFVLAASFLSAWKERGRPVPPPPIPTEWWTEKVVTHCCDPDKVLELLHRGSRDDMTLEEDRLLEEWRARTRAQREGEDV